MRSLPLPGTLATIIATASLLPSARAQVMIEVGSGTILNTAFEAPCPYANVQNGSRNQLLVLASELQSAGMSAGTILGLGFDVFQASGTTFNSFSISIGSTTVGDLTATWETGLSPAWGPTDFTDLNGWTYHAFDSPFFWDGTSNLVIETCYSNAFTTQNAQLRQSATSFVSCVARNSPQPTICTNPGGTHVLFQQRPNIRFQWMTLEAPPIAFIGSSATLSCTGTISFSDESLYTPTSWAWDFGDDSTSTEQDPTHTYLNSGVYGVTLIVTNDFGTDTAEVTVTVDLSGVHPIAACDAPSTGTVEGFGILNVGIEGVPHVSGDAVADGGYVDNTCGGTTVMQGTNLDLAVTTANAASHAVRAWLDMDNSGGFTPNELLLSATGPTPSSSTLIPAGVVLNTPLRLRVIAAYDLVTPDPQPCGDIQYGQAEDYAITVIANDQPPIASFSATPLFTCSGEVAFEDLSENTPTAWAWDFGDTNTSDEQNPVHVYSASGTYTVTLTVINANGQDDTVAVDLVTVDLSGLLIPAQCIPNTQAYCCGYGILGFSFAGINTTSADGSEGYQDLSCGNVAQVEEGQSYPWTVITTDNTPHDVRIWIDMDNDGDFTASELVATALDQVSPSGSITIPAGSVFDTPVRVRVQADVIGEITGPCDAPLFGQVEDVAARIQQSTEPPVADFLVSPAVTCDGVVQFTDVSTHLPTSWSWNFGDTQTSSEQNPQHIYTQPGTYTVSLTATNAYGTDSDVLSGAVVFVPGWQCDTAVVDAFNDTMNDECLGILSDDGGPNGNYQQGTTGAYTIAPTDAQYVTLTFSSFAWGNNQNRHLAIYDGPDVGSTLIGSFNGNGLNQLPNNGIITSSGSSITLRQEQTGGGGPPPNSSGFLLTWNCSLTGVHEITKDPIRTIRPQPADDWFAVDLEPTASAKRTLVLRNALGQVLETRSISGASRTERFETNGLPAGIHLLQVITDNEQWTRTLIIR